MPKYSNTTKQYFDSIQKQVRSCYSIADRARAKGLDPKLEVEIPQGEDLAARVEKLVGPPGIAKRIRQLSKKENREVVSLKIAKEIASKMQSDPEAALGQAVRTGLAVLTEGILVAPLEGVSRLEVGKNKDGTNYPDIYYSGPIRSAGGTAQAMSILIADVVRRELGLDRYKPTPQELERYKEELSQYKNLQYRPSDEEVELIVNNCPICIDGDGTEEYEVSGNRNLPRVPTNNVRGGMCLVLAEGLCQKAAKLSKHVNNLNIDGWDFINELAARKGSKKKDDQAIKPSWKYLKDVLAGRPIYSHPSRKGGLRLRYGRTRTTGLAALAVHPATMYVLNNSMAVGTQVKIERPGKACVITPCDVLEGPLVKLFNGSLAELDNASKAKRYRDQVKEIMDLGEILVPFGEFAENNHTLLPPAYSIEWWELEAEKAGAKDYPNFDEMDSDTAFSLSDEQGIPLHPKYNLFWHDITVDGIDALRKHIQATGRLEGEKLYMDKDEEVQAVLCELGATFSLSDDYIITERYGKALVRCLGFRNEDKGKGICEERKPDNRLKDPLKAVSHLAGFQVRPRAPTRIGTRMGRPEKAKERLMNPPPHGLFPVGEEGGMQRLLSEAVKAGTISVEVGLRQCPKCNKYTYENMCQCGIHTAMVGAPSTQKIDIKDRTRAAMRSLGIKKLPDVKGVKGMTSATKSPELLEKAILRARNEVYVFKDGTIRYDMTDAPLTHFTPREIKLDVDRAMELGYDTDIHGKPLKSEDQILELRVQDIIVSRECGRYLVKASRFIDDELVKVYGQKRYYNVKDPDDLLGHLLIGLAPHTSGGVVARLIGYTNSQVAYAHPFFHAAKRRNCDGDEDCVLLLLDGLLNFSRTYLPKTTGGQMDAPLVLATRIDPNEIDSEAHNIDVGEGYPLEFYEAAMNYASPKEVFELVDTVKSRIGTEGQYEGFKFTHPTSDISAGPALCAYKTLPDMKKKMDLQLELAVKIRAVDQSDTAARIIQTHFLPDIIGNLRAFSTQKFRCTRCNTKYRRYPLAGKCTTLKVMPGQGRVMCGGNVVMTVHPASVRKYLDIAAHIAEKYHVPAYTMQRLDLARNSVESLFDSDRIQKTCLLDF